MPECKAAKPGATPSRTVSVASNLLLEVELLRVVRHLEQAGVRCVVLKGTPLARRLYDAIDGRVIADNDVLVHTTDARRACALMQRDGYQPLPFLDLERRLRCTNQFLLFKRREGVTRLVEIHWNAFSLELFRVPEEVQWAHTQDFVLRGDRLIVFDPALTLAHLAAHFAQHGFAELRILRDLARAWNLWGGAHGADALALSDSIGLRPAVDYALRAAACFGWLAAPPPPVVSQRARSLLRLLPAERLTHELTVQSGYARQLLPLLIADPRAIPRSLALKVFPPLDELASTFGTPVSKRLYARYPSYWMRPVGRLLHQNSAS